MTRALYSIMVAVIVMLAVPVSQLRLVTVKHECCCPDPAKCHCPDEKDAPSDTSMKACHKSVEILASAGGVELTPEPITVIERPTTPIVQTVVAVPEPHAQPSLDRPRGPS